LLTYKLRHMKIRLIFSPKEAPEEGLWAVRWDDAATDAFRKLLAEWTDPEYMFQFCVDHLQDVQRKFGYAIEPAVAAEELMDEAEVLKELLYRLGTRQDPDTRLQQIFKPLGNEGSLTELQLSKASVKDRTFKDPKLRIYAVRVGENTYVVTGGAIKLTDRMGERAHTQAQWERVQRARDWLKSENIVYPEDLNELL
jgi:hypothetical protein